MSTARLAAQRNGVGNFGEVVAYEHDIGDSIATSTPAAPIATPTFAVASAGASLTPSPTIATAP